MCNPSVSSCHKFVFVNNCTSAVYVGALGNSGMVAPNNGGWRLNPGISNATTIYLPIGWGVRFWARTGCDTNGLNCDTGDCGRLQCNGLGGQPNVTLAEFTLDAGSNKNQDFYDVSNVDAYSMSIKIDPIPGTFTKNNSNNQYECGSPTCTYALDLTKCPVNLQVKNPSGTIVACQSPCQKLNSDQVCCRGNWGTSQTCITSQWPEPYDKFPQLVKTACPLAYSYPYDDGTSTFTCQSLSPSQLTGYTITFCSI